MTAISESARELAQGSGCADRRAAVMQALYLEGDTGDEYASGDGDGVARYGRTLHYWDNAGFYSSETFADVWSARVAFAVASVPWVLAGFAGDIGQDAVDTLVTQAMGGDPHARVPCSPYGHNSAECAEVAVTAYLLDDMECPADGDSSDVLQHYMTLTVNGHDDITRSLSCE